MLVAFQEGFEPPTDSLEGILLYQNSNLTEVPYATISADPAIAEEL